MEAIVLTPFLHSLMNKGVEPTLSHTHSLNGTNKDAPENRRLAVQTKKGKGREALKRDWLGPGIGVHRGALKTTQVHFQAIGKRKESLSGEDLNKGFERGNPMLNKMMRNLIWRLWEPRETASWEFGFCMPSFGCPCLCCGGCCSWSSIRISSFQANEYTNNREESERSNYYERRERSTNATISRVSIPRPTTSSSFESINSHRSFT